MENPHEKQIRGTERAGDSNGGRKTIRGERAKHEHSLLVGIYLITVILDNFCGVVAT